MQYGEGIAPGTGAPKRMGEWATDPEEVKDNAEKKNVGNKKKNLKTAVAITAAGLAATAAIGLGVREAVNNKAELPDNRFTPERTAPVAAGEGQLTPEQLQEKATIDAAEAAAEKAKVESATAPSEIPETVKDQNLEGLDTTKIE